MQNADPQGTVKKGNKNEMLELVQQLDTVRTSTAKFAVAASGAIQAVAIRQTCTTPTPPFDPAWCRTAVDGVKSSRWRHRYDDDCKAAKRGGSRRGHISITS